MKQLVIIGAGGMGRTMFDMARESWGHETELKQNLVYLLEHTHQQLL